ncbi:Thymidylate kinase (fragment) [uncultured Desulfatiglans sp.]|uniref:Thymidylate kinase n=1 Tax=Uncultured Desulfatiglans sp. TaxID=1748965 RepID=A0A653A6T9_UNCDX
MIDRNRKPRKTSYYAPKKVSLSAMIKPPIALFDNILFYLVNRPRNKNEVYIYDRFISATQIKMAALNYRTQWLRCLWGNIKTPLTFYIDIDAETSLTRQVSRKDPYTYPVEILQKERQEYLRLAQRHKYTIIRNDRSIKAAFADLISSIGS